MWHTWDGAGTGTHVPFGARGERKSVKTRFGASMLITPFIVLFPLVIDVANGGMGCFFLRLLF